ncbi:MAG TPA: DUF885 family protein, partial [Candidatus Baltobacteraceae bacterium]|nr:DUF885 family protein [Candidatus Baltobacteraceae bacterium]
MLIVAALLSIAVAPTGAASTDASYRSRLADLDRRYTLWSLEQNPTSATDAGIHTYDGRLADFSPQAQAAQMAHLRALRNELAALQPGQSATPHDRVDYLLVRADLEGDWWQRTVLQPLTRNPTIYEGECANGIFAILKRQYASDRTRLADAIARLRACPRVLEQGKANLTDTVREFAQIASEDIADGDSLYTTSLDELAGNASPSQRDALHRAQSTALTALHSYRSWLQAHMSAFHTGGFAVGKQQYDWYLRRVLLLPYDSEQVARIGELELARDRALRAWEA